jgi:peptide/nickel transport system substrate-binding protein
LKQAGYVIPAEGSNVREKEGEAIRIELLHPDDELHTAIAESIQRDWELLEIGVDLVALPYDELVSARLDNRDYEAALVDLNLSRAPDPDPYPFWDQAEATGGQNYTQWDSRSASEYIEQARVSIDLSERERLYRNFQVIFNDEVPAIPLYYPVYTYAVDSQVQGVQMGPLFDNSDRFATVNNWFIVSSFSAAEETPASPDEP